MLAAIGLAFMRDGNEVALMAAFAAVIGSFLVSYTRAKAEAIGLRGDVGFGSRVERVVLISIGLGLAPWGLLQWPIYVLAAIAWLTVAPADPLRAPPAARARRDIGRAPTAWRVRPGPLRSSGSSRQSSGDSCGRGDAMSLPWRFRGGVLVAVVARGDCSRRAHAASELIARNATACPAPGRRAGSGADLVPLGGPVETAPRVGRGRRRPPSQTQPQVAFKLQYGGSIGPNVCGAYRGPPLAWKVAACTTTNGDALGAAGVAADAPELRRRGERRPRRLGAPALALVRTRREARALDGLVVPPLPSPLRPAHAQGRRRLRLPLDPLRGAAGHVRTERLRRHVRQHLRAGLAEREQLPHPQADRRVLLRVLSRTGRIPSATERSTGRP